MECGGVKYKGVYCILVSHFIGFLLWFLNDCWLISKSSVVWFSGFLCRVCDLSLARTKVLFVGSVISSTQLVCFFQIPYFVVQNYKCSFQAFNIVVLHTVTKIECNHKPVALFCTDLHTPELKLYNTTLQLV